MSRKKDDAVITTILGQDCQINGDFIVKQSARIDGEVQGNVCVRHSDHGRRRSDRGKR